MKLCDHVGIALTEAALTDSRVWVLDGDLADSDGAIHFAERIPSRFVMAGIAEQNMVSMAAGMATCGSLPWVFSFAAFLSYRAYDQVRIGLSQAKQPVVLVATHAGGCAGRNGKSHTAPNDLALMLSLPNMHVWAPADAEDVRFMVQQLLSDPAPAYVRLPRTPIATDGRLPGIAADHRWLGEPEPIVLAATGFGTRLALEVQGRLKAQGISISLLHFARVAPLPRLPSELARAERIFVVEDHCQFGGLGSLLSTQPELAGIPLRTFGWPMNWSGKSGSDDALVRAGGMHPEQIAEAIGRALRPAPSLAAGA